MIAPRSSVIIYDVASWSRFFSAHMSKLTHIDAGLLMRTIYRINLIQNQENSVDGSWYEAICIVITIVIRCKYVSKSK